jgi:hypothetical protein
VAVFTDEQKQKILAALTRTGVTLPCSRCGNKNLTLVDGLASPALGDGKTTVAGSVPSIVTICTKCGAVYFHSLGVLGLFEEFGFKP